MKRVSATVLAALFVSPVAGLAAGGATTPVTKVLDLLSGLQGQVAAEGEEADKAYAQFSEWCEDQTKSLNFDIKTGQGEIESLNAVIAEEAAKSSALSTKIEELAASIATDEKDLKAATELRSMENTDFLAAEKELSETADTIDRAVVILEREMGKGGAALLQGTSVDGVVGACALWLRLRPYPRQTHRGSLC